MVYFRERTPMKTLYAKLLTMGILLAVSARAETVITRNLHALHGKIVAQTDEWIELRMEYGTLRIPREDIVRIEKDTPQMVAECSYTVKQSKDFAEKMTAEGRILYHGRWVTPEEKAEDEARLAEATQRAADQLAEEQRQLEEAIPCETDAQALIDSQILQEEARYYLNHFAPYDVRQRILGNSNRPYFSRYSYSY
jgi:hypothetical protein